ncbi:MAG: DUF3857 domain-containing protein [Candidatus Eisenbacteria bacterium]|nr:DUF3857 domain-containing protein [Candidatus Eisenbacteria bacterium]
MRTRTTIILTAAAVFALASAAAAVPADAAGRHDIGRLLELGDQWFDLESQDAVILLDSLHIERLPSGTVVRTTHTIVWFGTENGLDAYADVHVPWNALTGSIEVHHLRTWRDERWWPAPDSVSRTAVVETTPGAVYSAYDYAKALRQQALLHDGVEVPCVVETRYTVTEARAPSLGMDGSRVASAPDPTVRNALFLRMPEGENVAFETLRGAPAPEVSGDGGHAWSMTRIDRLGRPLVRDRTAASPTLVWSTWPSWDALAESFLTPFEGAAVLEGAPLDSLAERTKGRHGAEDLARAAAAYLAEATRHVGADHGAWLFGPRPAQRTWETSYGHAVDRAVAACALLREVGLEAEPVWVGYRDTDLTESPPGLSRFEQLLVEVRGAGFQGTLDPATARLTSAGPTVAGRTLWRPGDEDPSHRPAEPGVLEVAVRLERNEDGGFGGRGYVLGTGWLAPYGSVAGLDGALGGYADRLVRSVLPGSSAESPGLTALETSRVEAGFDVVLDAPGEDDLGRIPLVVGDPTGGILDGFEPSLELAVPTRGTAVRLPAPATQSVMLEIDTGEGEPAHVPEETDLRNEAGTFSLTVDRDGSWVTVERRLEVDNDVGPDLWPELRALLLEWNAPRNRTLLLD